MIWNLGIPITFPDQQWQNITVEEYLPGRGRGVFCLDNLKKGQVICDYHGRKMTGLSRRAVEETISKLPGTDYTMVVGVQNVSFYPKHLQKLN